MDVDDNNKNDERTDDPMVHWERFQDSGRKKMKLMKDVKEKLEEEKDRLQKEIDTMNSIIAAAANVSADDIIEIDAGGTIIKVLRSTLTLVPDTVFSYMFSGRWEKSLKRDTNGRVFLDEDPEFIETIINFLRHKKREDPSNPIQSPPPQVREEKKENFHSLLDYYGLTDFFYPPSTFVSLDIKNIDVVLPDDSGVDVTKSENMIQFAKSSRYNHSDVVTCKPTLDSSGEGSFWKVTIDKLPSPYIFLGIIGNLDASNSKLSYYDPTCYGWLSRSKVNQGVIVRNEESGWTAFTQGERLHFHLTAKKLTMFRVQKNQKCAMDVATTDAFYIHFNMIYEGTKVTLEPLSEEEHAYFLVKLNES